MGVLDAPGIRTRSRRALAVLSTPFNLTFNNAEMTFRLPFAVPIGTRQWRLRIRNINALSDIPQLNGATFVASYLGEQAIDANGDPTGGFAAAPAQALPGFTMAADGAEIVSGWVTTPSLQFTANRSYLLSMAYTAGGTINWGTNRCWFAASVGAAALVNQQSGSGFTSFYAAPFDVRIEYDTVLGDNLIVAVIGDSTTQGCGSNVGSPIAAERRWPEQWAARTGNPTANGAVSSATMVTYGTTTAWILQRLLPSLITYDVIIASMGVNDIGAGLATFKTRHATMIAALRTLFGADVRIFANGVKPNEANPHSLLAAKVAAGANTIVTSASYTTGIQVRVGAGWKQEFMTTTGTSTGTGPYTTTLTANLANGHDIGEVVAEANERNRLDANNFLSFCPSGIEAFHPTHRAVQAPFDAARWDPQLSSDGLHPSVEGHCVEGAATPTITRNQHT